MQSTRACLSQPQQIADRQCPRFAALNRKGLVWVYAVSLLAPSAAEGRLYVAQCTSDVKAAYGTINYRTDAETHKEYERTDQVEYRFTDGPNARLSKGLGNGSISNYHFEGARREGDRIIFSYKRIGAPDFRHRRADGSEVTYENNRASGSEVYTFNLRTGDFWYSRDASYQDIAKNFINQEERQEGKCVFKKESNDKVRDTSAFLVFKNTYLTLENGRWGMNPRKADGFIPASGRGATYQVYFDEVSRSSSAVLLRDPRTNNFLRVNKRTGSAEWRNGTAGPWQPYP